MVKETHSALDSAISRSLTELALLPGNVRAAPTELESNSAERSIPVDERKGHAKGDLTLAEFQKMARSIKTIKGKKILLAQIEEEIMSVKIASKRGWYDLSIVEGRLRAGELAERIGVKATAASLDRPIRSVYRWRDEYRKTIRGSN